MNETNFEVPVEGPLFPLGKIAITAAAMQSLSPSDVFDGLTRHGFGDWGTVCMKTGNQTMRPCMRMEDFFQLIGPRTRRCFG